MDRNVNGEGITCTSSDGVRELAPICQSSDSAEAGPHSNRRAGAGSAPARLLRLRDVCALTGLGKSIIYRMQSEKRFPQRVKITEHAVGWVEAEVCVWIAQRVSTRDGRSVPK